MPKKKKTINVKPTMDYDKIQIDIKGVINDDKKIKPDKIFDGYRILPTNRRLYWEKILIKKYKPKFNLK